eukprot:1213642-Prymnesium_polylepis.1
MAGGFSRFLETRGGPCAGARAHLRDEPATAVLQVLGGQPAEHIGLVGLHRPPVAAHLRRRHT